VSGGSSSSETSTTTTDGRLVLDGGSIGTSAPGTAQGLTAVALSGDMRSSQLHMEMLDAGAIDGAFRVVDGMLVSGAAMVEDLLSSSADIFSDLIASNNAMVRDFHAKSIEVQESQGALIADAYSNSDQTIATAYTDSKGTKDVLVIGALLIGGVAIAFMLKK
jgi:hypothetical protein